MTELFVGRAKVETMQRDFNRLRKEIRAWNPEQAEKAFDKCERWIGCISATSGISQHNRTQDQIERIFGVRVEDRPE